MSANLNNENVHELFARNVPGSFEILSRCTVGIAGAGGLGSNVAIQLTRAGIGRLIIADFDTVALDNLNRQQFFLDQIGKSKIQALEENLKRINPGIDFEGHEIRLTPENIPEIFGNVDAVVEAFDGADQKTMLIETWISMNNQKLLVGVSGVGGYGRCEEIKIHRFSVNLIMVGDQKSKMTEGLMAPRVSLAASIQANLVVEYLIDKAKGGNWL